MPLVVILMHHLTSARPQSARLVGLMITNCSYMMKHNIKNENGSLIWEDINKHCYLCKYILWHNILGGLQNPLNEDGIK